MNKWLRIILLTVIVIMIIAFWGSIASAALTLGLLAALGVSPIRWFLKRGEDNDYQYEE